MTRVFSNEFLRLLGIAGIAGISLMTILGVYISRFRGSFAPFRKATIIYLLCATVILALPGLAGYYPVFKRPAITLACCQLLFFIMGLLHITYMHKYLKWSGREKSFWLEALFTLVISVFGFLAFTIVFSWLNKEGYQYFMASSIAFFLIAQFVYHTFSKAAGIPVKVYKKWFYPVHEEVADPDDAKLKNMLVISFEFQKKSTDKYFTSFRAKAPADMEFGQLFYYFINDYNERHPDGKIEFVNEQGIPYGWVFYKKPRWYHFGINYIETENSFFINHVKENAKIVCERV